jgi:ABC-2 type transport system ATP-binding protein
LFLFDLIVQNTAENLCGFEPLIPYMSIVVENITKVYGEQKALNNVSFRIAKGEIVGFLGRNGAGKSTMMKILTTFLKETSGSAVVNAFDATSEARNVQKSGGYLPEHNPLYMDMHVREYLAFNANLYKTPKSRIDEVIAMTGLLP